jgi:transposase InsO family protein
MTSPYYPQSNGKLDRFHQTVKDQAIRPRTQLELRDAKRIVGEFIEYCNTTRLHSAIGFIAPQDRLAGRHHEIHKARGKSSKTRGNAAESPVRSSPWHPG